MKRFYCSICKRVKRVRSFPSITNSNGGHSVRDNLTGKLIDTAIPPENRIGQCLSHSPNYTSPNRHPSKPKFIKSSSVPSVKTEKLVHSSRRKGAK